jgi:DNA-binding MarR family transcriptional regulator
LEIPPVPQPPDDAHRAIASLQRLTELFAERRRQLAREAGLTETRWRLLEEVEGGTFMPSMFARRRARSAAAVSRTLRQLLDQDLVRASIDSADGRQRIYALTPRGRRTLAGLRRRRERAVEEIWGPFGSARLRSFQRFAEELADRLETYLERAPAPLSDAPRRPSGRADATR